MFLRRLPPVSSKIQCCFFLQVDIKVLIYVHYLITKLFYNSYIIHNKFDNKKGIKLTKKFNWQGKKEISKRHNTIVK